MLDACHCGVEDVERPSRVADTRSLLVDLRIVRRNKADCATLQARRQIEAGLGGVLKRVLNFSKRRPL